MNSNDNRRASGPYYANCNASCSYGKYLSTFYRCLQHSKSDISRQPAVLPLASLPRPSLAHVNLSSRSWSRWRLQDRLEASLKVNYPPSSRTEPSRAEPSRAGPGRAEPSRASRDGLSTGARPVFGSARHAREERRRVRDRTNGRASFGLEGYVMLATWTF